MASVRARKRSATGDSSPERSRTSRQTVSRILVSAQNVLVDGGHANFTMRAVAAAAGISPGNLGYHFPTRTALLQAVVQHMVEGYAAQFEDILSSPGQRFEDGLEQFVRLLMEDSAAEYTVRTFRELWAIALHDDVVRVAIDDFYDYLTELVTGLLRELRPDADVQAIRESVQLLVLITEGTAVLYGTRRERAVSWDRVTELITTMLGARHRS